MTPREQLADKLDDMHITPLSHEMAVENSRLVGQAAAETMRVNALSASRLVAFTVRTARCSVLM